MNSKQGFERLFILLTKKLETGSKLLFGRD